MKINEMILYKNTEFYDNLVTMEKLYEGGTGSAEEARNIAAQGGMEKEFAKLDRIISALLATRPATILTTESGRARAAGMPYDEQRAQLFSLLYDTLSSKFFKEILDKNTDAINKAQCNTTHYANSCFLPPNLKHILRLDLIGS